MFLCQHVLTGKLHLSIQLKCNWGDKLPKSLTVNHGAFAINTKEEGSTKSHRFVLHGVFFFCLNKIRGKLESWRNSRNANGSGFMILKLLTQYEKGYKTEPANSLFLCTCFLEVGLQMNRIAPYVCSLCVVLPMNLHSVTDSSCLVLISIQLPVQRWRITQRHSHPSMPCNVHRHPFLCPALSLPLHTVFIFLSARLFHIVMLSRFPICEKMWYVSVGLAYFA